MTSGDVLYAALAELLCRRCLGDRLVGDAESARRILLDIRGQGVKAELLAAATGGVWAAFRPDSELTAQLASAALESARALLLSELAAAERLLVAVSLALLVERGASDRAAPDMVAVAISAQRIDQDRLGRWAAERALARRTELTLSQEAASQLTLALFTQDRADVLAAYALTASLPADDPRAVQAEMLRPSLHPDATTTMSTVGEAVRAGDRRSAAAALADEFGETYRETNDVMVGGLQAAMASMAGPDIEVEAARRALSTVLRELRGRQRYGQVPPVARTGIDMVLDMLKTDATPASIDVMAELMEALADAGLSNVLLAAETDEVPALVQARLAAAAHEHPVWPDLQACINGLDGRPVLLLRRQRMFSAAHGAVLSFFIEPPDGGAIKSTLLATQDTTLLQTFGGGDLTAMAVVTAEELDTLVRALLPAALLDRLSHGLGSLLIIPDDALWSVPWQAAPVFSGTMVSLAPSLSVYGGLQPFDGVVRSITALVDDHIPESGLVRDSLALASQSGRVEVREWSGSDVAVPSDLLLVFAHGGGRGLNFRTSSVRGSVTAIQLATAVQARVALVASCRSLAAPPVSFPMNLPAAMMLSGISAVFGALWPLPASSTASIVAETVSALVAGEGVSVALARARSAAVEGLPHRWGLAAHGRVDP